MMNRKYFSLLGLAALLMTLVFMSSVFAAPPPAPGAPPDGKAWVWQKAHWEMVDQAPSPTHRWERGKWNPERNEWVPGRWAEGKKFYKPAKKNFPGRAPHGKTWIWVDAGWDLVPAPPAGPCEWKPGYWDKAKRIWIDGLWISISTRPGRDWVAPHWDRDHNRWMDGRWEKRVPPPLPVVRPPRPEKPPVPMRPPGPKPPRPTPTPVPEPPMPPRR